MLCDSRAAFCDCSYRSPMQTLGTSKLDPAAAGPVVPTPEGYVPASGYQPGDRIVIDGSHEAIAVPGVPYALDPASAFTSPFGNTGQGIDSAGLIAAGETETGPVSAPGGGQAPDAAAAKPFPWGLALSVLGFLTVGG